MVDHCSPSMRPLQKVVDKVLWFTVAWVTVPVRTSLEWSSKQAGPRHFGRWPRCAAKRTVRPGITLPGLELAKFQQVGFWIAIVKWRQLDYSHKLERKRDSGDASNGWHFPLCMLLPLVETVVGEQTSMWQSNAPWNTDVALQATWEVVIDPL